MLAAVAATAFAIGAWSKSIAAGSEITELIEAAEAGQLDTIVQLIEGGLNVDACSEIDGRTALAAAAASGQVAAVQLLLSQGADPRARTVNGTLAVHAATAAGHTLIVQRLLDRDRGMLDTADMQGQTPLHIACSRSHTALLDIFLSYNASPDARRADGCTALCIAATAGCVGCVSTLLEHGCDYNAVDKAGNSALHHACLAVEPTVVDLLLNAGAAMFVPNAQGYTPVDLASAAPPPPLPTGNQEPAESLVWLLDRHLTARLRHGHQEANAAQAVRSALVARLRAISMVDPMLLASLCKEDATQRLLRRFDIDPARVVPRLPEEQPVATESRLADGALLRAVQQTASAGPTSNVPRTDGSARAATASPAEIAAEGEEEEEELSPTAHASLKLRQFHNALDAV